MGARGLNKPTSARFLRFAGLADVMESFFGGLFPAHSLRLRIGHAFGVAAGEIFQGTRRETLSRRATGWMAATAKGAAGFLGTKKGGRRSA